MEVIEKLDKIVAETGLDETKDIILGALISDVVWQEFIRQLL